MPRLLRISGILFFAILIGFMANRLQELYEAGTLFEQYNSQRKADITLLIVSICGLAALGFFELVLSRRRVEQHGFGLASIKKDPEPAVGDSASIYAAPEAIDEWQGRQERISKSRRRLSLEISGLWMSLLRVCCGVLPVVYLYTLVDYLFIWLPTGAGSLGLSILFPVLFLGSALASVGILRKKVWGLNFGYAMAIFHLLIFPIGTAAGLVMLVGLMGATSEFTTPEREHRRKAIRRAKRRRKAKRRKLQSAAM
ncbi:MAG: hypothetical protein ABFR33_04710 [Verrucomicrobiota bacterium]